LKKNTCKVQWKNGGEPIITEPLTDFIQHNKLGGRRETRKITSDHKPMNEYSKRKPRLVLISFFTKVFFTTHNPLPNVSCFIMHRGGQNTKSATE
jgi:hypothetical protein